jgi:hypothetical protein
MHWLSVAVAELVIIQVVVEAVAALLSPRFPPAFLLIFQLLVLVEPAILVACFHLLHQPMVKLQPLEESLHPVEILDLITKIQSITLHPVVHLLMVMVREDVVQLRAPTLLQDHLGCPLPLPERPLFSVVVVVVVVGAEIEMVARVEAVVVVPVVQVEMAHLD